MPSSKHVPAPPTAHRAVHVAVHAPATHGHDAPLDPSTQALIAKGYVPSRQLTGKVVGVWGQALLRDADGHIHPLKVGHVIQKGEVVLTGQDGIVQLEGGRHASPGDLERVIAEVGRGDNPETAPAAGLQGGDGGDMQPGLRVDRISESVTPASIGTEPFAQDTLVSRSDETVPAATPAPSLAAPDTVTVPEDTPVTFDPRSNDQLAGGGTPAVTTVGGQPISVDHPVVLPQGTVSLNPDGTLSFTPAPDFNGFVTIPYTVGDGQGHDAGSTITVTVTPVNDPPVAADDGFTTTEDTPLVIDPRGNDSDPDGDPLTVTQVNGQPIDATHPVTLTGGNGQPIGTVSLNGDGTLTFTPAPDYNGPADFDYTVSDGQGGTDTAHVGLTVTPVDDTPSIVDDSATTPEGTPVLIDVLANDSDGDADSLTITQVNGHDIAVGSPVSLVDANGLPLGEVRLTADGQLEFTPAPGTNGPVDFSYTATDGHTPVQANVHVDVTPVNDPPLAGDDHATVAEDTPITLNLLGNDSDADGDTLTITQINGHDITPGTPVALDDGAGHAIGTVTVNADGSVTFDPAPGYNGPASFGYTLSDGHGGSDTATVSIDVGGVNDAPVAAPDTGSTSEDATLVVDAAHGVIRGAGTDTDPDGDSLSVSDVAFGGSHGSVGSPIAGAWGTLTLNADGSYSYVPNTAAQALHDGDSRADVFTYTVTDPTGATSTTTLTLTVTGRNDAPVAVDDSGITPEDTPLTLDLRSNDSDADGDALSVTAIDGHPLAVGSPVSLTDGNGQPVGQVSLGTDGKVTFTPAAGYNGPVDFDYTLSDGSATDIGHVHLVVDAVNDPPVAQDNQVTGFEDSPVTFDPRSNDTDPDGDALAITQINGQPISLGHPVSLPEGQISLNADGTLSFQPEPNYHGTLAFDYTISDSRGGTDTAQVTLTIQPVDDLPAAGNDSFSTAEDSALSGSLGGNDTLSGDGGNVFALGTGAAHGTVTVNADGTFTYTPAANYNGPDSFTYTLTDADGDVSTATVTVNVASVDDLPVAKADTFAATEDTVLNGSVAGNDTLSGDGGNVFALGTGAAHGTVTVNADGTFTYTPAANYNGPDSFTYTLTDADGDISTATVTVNVASVDDLPVAKADTFAATEDTVLNGSVAGNDTLSGDGGNVFALGTGTSHGTVTVNADGTFTYTPAANYNGPDSFTYTLTDADGDVSTATVTVNVTSVDDLPVAKADTFAANEDTVLNGSVAGNDTLSGDGGNVFALGAGAAHGTVTVNADGTFTYTPAANYNGPDSFTYTLTDADGDVSTATVTVNVASVDDLPVAKADTFAATEDTVLNGSVANNDTLSGDGGNVFALGTGTSHGTVTVNADGTFTYTPAANYNGPDSFTYTLTDADGDVSTATVTLNVAADNDAPVANDDTFSATEDQTVTGNLGTNDDLSGDGGNVFALSTGAAHGTVVVNADGTFTYTPAANYNGPDSFIYTLTDADGDVSTATVTVNVASVDDLPVAKADTFAATEDTVLNGSVAGNDTLSGDGGNVFALGTGAAHGTVTVNADGTFTYTPAANYNGPDSFTYTLTDADGDVSTATVTVNVASVDDLPVAKADTFAATEDTVLNGSVAGNDTLSGDGGNVFALGTGAAHGTVIVNADGTFTYTPAANYNGPDSFTYTLTDADGDVSTATVTVNVASVDDLPVAKADTFAATEDTVLNGNVAGNDTLSGDGGNVFALGTGAAHGTVTVNADGTFTYTPAANYNGPDSFTYTLTDADGDVSTATVTLNVASVDDLPTAKADTFSATEDTVLSGSVAGNDTLSGDGGNVFALGTAAAHGTVTVNTDGTFTYTPAANYSGPDSFTYTLTDADGDVSTATVTVNVASVDDLPVAKADTFSATEDTVLNGSVAGNDTLSGDGGNVFALGAAAAHGTVTVNADGTFTYTPATNYNGPDSFTYTLTDADGDVSTATVTVNVASVDDLPVAKADTFAATEDTVLNGSVAGNDTLSGDGGNVFALGTGAAHGTVTVNADGTFTYTPAANYNGPDSFTYMLTDADGDVSTATVTVNVASVDDLPVAKADTFAATEDTVLNGSVAGNDTLSGDGDNVFALGTGAAHGTVTVNADGTFTYTPTANYNGPDSFTYTLTDADGDVSTATVTLNVASVDDLPTAKADTFNATEDTVLNGSVAGNDTLSGDGGNVFALGTGAAHGTVTFNADGTFTYTPTANYNGPDSFTYTLTDADGDVSTATVTVNVAPVDDLPVAKADTFAATEDTVLNGSVAGNDTLSGDGGNVFALGTGTSHGTVTVNADGTFTYTPAANYNGPDSFTYTLTDADGDVSTATVTLNVASVDDLPVAKADTFAATEDTVLNGSVAGNDTLSGDGGNVFALGMGAAHGTVTVNADGTFTYTPTANYNGPDSFTYTLTDADGDVSTATVTLNVASVDDLPIAKADTFSATEDTVLNGSVAGNDTLSGDGGNVFALGTGTAHGTVTVNADGTFTYTPAANYNGPDSFTYTLTDADGDVSTATVTLNVASVDDLPVAKSDTFAATEDTVLNGSVAGNDTLSGDGGNVFALGTGAAHGNVTVNADGTFTYTPAANYNGPDSFTYTLTDADGDVSTATVTLGVAAVNDAPVVNPESVSTLEDAAKTGNVLSNDSDVEGSALSVVSFTWNGVAHTITAGGTAVASVAGVGTVSMGSDGNYTFTPAANYSGNVPTVGYTVSDGSSTSSTTLSIGVVAVADAPTLTLNSTTVTGGTTSSGGLPPSTGLTRAFYDELALTTAAAADAKNLETAVESTGPTSTSTVTDVAIAQANFDTGDAYRYTGYVYLEAGHTYTISGYRDDTMQVKLGGTTVYSLGYNNWGTYTGDGLTVTVSGYYSVEVNVFDGDGIGQLDLNMSVDGGAAVDFNTTNFNLYANAADLANSSGVLGDFVPNNDGGFYPVELIGADNTYISLGKVAATLVDTDGSESLKVTVSTIPVGATITDGTHSFTATAGSTSVDVSAWSLNDLQFKSTAGFSGAVDLTVTATATEGSNGSAASSSGQMHIVVADATPPSLYSESTLVLVNQGTSTANTYRQVDFPITALPDSGESITSIAVNGLPVGVVISDGNHSFTASMADNSVDVAGWDLGNLTLTVPTSFNTTGSTITVTATSTVYATVNGVNTAIDSASSSDEVTLVADYTTTTTTGNSGNETLTGTSADNYISGAAGNDTISGAAGNDLLLGGTGNDSITGGANNDVVYGEAGNDSLDGGSEADRLIGGAGNDTLTGGTGAADLTTDVFQWTLGDAGTAGSPAADAITDFNANASSAGGDILDLHDLLVGESSTNLLSFLHFSTSGGNTVISISSSGGYSGGYSAGQTDQTITLTGVDLVTGHTDAQIIADLLAKGKLVVDG